MTEKRYYQKDWEDSYYIFDSKTISENEFEEKVEYDGYDVFADSLTPKEVINLLNENEQLKDILKDITIQLDANHTMNTYQMVIPINRVIYNELNRRLKETSFNEELRRVLDD